MTLVIPEWVVVALGVCVGFTAFCIIGGVAAHCLCDRFQDLSPYMPDED